MVLPAIGILDLCIVYIGTISVSAVMLWVGADDQDILNFTVAILILSAVMVGGAGLFIVGIQGLIFIVEGYRSLL